AELLLLLGAGLLPGTERRRAAPDRVAVADQHLDVVPGRDVRLVVAGAAELRKRERRRAVAGGRRVLRHGTAAEQAEGAARRHALVAPAADELGNGFHRTFPSAFRILSGVNGIAVTRALSGSSASLMAFITAPGAPAVPASPTPFAPSCDCLVGVSTCAQTMSGISPDIGTR